MPDYFDLCERFWRSPLYTVRLGRNPQHALVQIVIRRIFDRWLSRPADVCGEGNGNG
jgi:hypothetical protein